MPKGVYPRRVKRHAVTQPQDPSYRLIPLTQGQNAIVDTADFEWLSQWHWFADRDYSTESFYAKRAKTLTSGRISMHKQILNCGNEKGDHKNGNTLDNRRSNLRRANSFQSVWNRRIPRNNTSGFKGVTYDKVHDKWRCFIGVHGMHKTLGYFDDPEQAAHVRDEAAKKYHGEFAVLNFP